MVTRGSDCLLYRLLKNERGALFPFAIVLLFVMTGAFLIYTNTLIAEIKSYNALESINISATIKVLKEIDR